jgi:hypothetical protein
MAGERHSGGPPYEGCPQLCFGSRRALGLLLSRALSSRLPVSIIGYRRLWSSVRLVE